MRRCASRFPQSGSALEEDRETALRRDVEMPEATGLHAGLSSRLADSHVSSPQIHEDEGHMDALHVLIQKVSTMYPRPSMPLTLSWMTNTLFWIHFPKHVAW
jgi:hypothetical protein